MITIQQAFDAMMNQDTLYYIGNDGTMGEMIPGVIGRLKAYLYWQNSLHDSSSNEIDRVDKRYVVMSLDASTWKHLDDLYVNKDEVVQIIIARKQSEIETLRKAIQ